MFRIRIALQKQEDFKQACGNLNEPIGTAFAAGDISQDAIKIATELLIIHPIHKNFLAGNKASKYMFSNGLEFILVEGQHPTAVPNAHGKKSTKEIQDKVWTLLTAVVECDFGKKTTLPELISQLRDKLITVDAAEVERTELRYQRRAIIAGDLSVLSTMNIEVDSVFEYAYEDDHVFEARQQLVQPISLLTLLK